MTFPFFSRLAATFALAAVLLFFPIHSSVAGQYSLPETHDALIGEILYTSASHGESVIHIGQRYNVGLNSMLSANPGLTERPLPAGTSVKVPAGFILPPLDRKGIIINLAEMRMYYYPKGTNTVMTYPIGIGKVGKTIRVGNTSIVRKVVNPVWIPTDSIREFNREQGIELPSRMPAGPDNPLGPYAIYLKIPTYLIHSTIFPESIGRRASFGCIRMHESDIKEFFPLVEPGTPVTIVNIPNKVGWSGNHLYLETHEQLVEYEDKKALDTVVNSIEQQIKGKGLTMVNWQMAAYLADQRDGVPHEIGFRIE